MNINESIVSLSNTILNIDKTITKHLILGGRIMSTVLVVSTIILCFAGVVFSFVYIWQNTFSKITDLESRNAEILKISRTSMVLSLIFALLACLLTNPNEVSEAINRTSNLYSIIAISWLIVIIGCGVSMLIAFVSKSTFRKGLLKPIKKVFSIALVGFIIAMILAWLLS